MHKTRICPICYGKVYSESWGVLNKETGFYEQVYTARCVDCLVKVEGKTVSSLNLFPVVEATEVERVVEDRPVVFNTNLYVPSDWVYCSHPIWITGLSDRVTLEERGE